MPVQDMHLGCDDEHQCCNDEHADSKNDHNDSQVTWRKTILIACASNSGKCGIEMRIESIEKNLQLSITNTFISLCGL